MSIHLIFFIMTNREYFNPIYQTRLIFLINLKNQLLSYRNKESTISTRFDETKPMNAVLFQKMSHYEDTIRRFNKIYSLIKIELRTMG